MAQAENTAAGSNNSSNIQNILACEGQSKGHRGYQMSEHSNSDLSICLECEHHHSRLYWTVSSNSTSEE
ncbi:hypothetical protein PAAG_11848 [Paracoccidioides lutzii Pb01]|uniref:Uncharacterized protein n=1 Tax=Paracoccidioides lutzii (strain ATCC MYA-826 / Pb01) TaxID=502779 RepID=A0A0A2V5F5_PARBA|nr:hypothetical protein PAAG_11848 [Paracoccidioides lutzii Pb01]KGQ01385.1 hypothetical protein PAAG_11848 [Paracoccidioides lutzii Pb01]